MVVAAQIGSCAFGCCKLCQDRRFVLFERLGDRSEVLDEGWILVLVGQSLGPVEREVVVAGAGIGLADTRLGRLSAGYTFTRKNSDIDVNDYTNNIVFVNAALTF